MSYNLSLVNTDLTTEITSVDLGNVAPGSTTEKLLGIKNNTTSTINSVIVAPWPGMKNNTFQNTSGSPIYSARVIRVNATGTLQTQDIAKETDSDAILDFDSIDSGNYIYYTRPYFILGTGSYFMKDDSVTPVYTPLSPSVVEANYGKITFASDPTGGDPAHTVVGDFSIKLPQPDTYLLTFPSVNTCSINGGSAVGILANDVYKNTNVISGMEIVFSSSLAITDTATIQISFALDSCYLKLPAGAYANKDLSLGNIAAGAVASFYFKQAPDVTETSTDNSRCIEIFAYGSV